MSIITINPEGPIATILIDNAAHRNALTFAMWEQLAETCSCLSHTKTVRVVILRGAGGDAFSAGADLSEFIERRQDVTDVAAYDYVIQAGMQAVLDLPIPVIAQLNGTCVGGGVALALMADIRIIGATSRFGIPAAKLGIAYRTEWIARLTQIVGVSAASSLLLSARLFDAQQALNWGFAAECVPDSEVETTVVAYAALLAELAPLSLQASKAALQATLTQAGLARAQNLIAECDTSADYQRGVAAFLTGTKPIFEGN